MLHLQFKHKISFVTYRITVWAEVTSSLADYNLQQQNIYCIVSMGRAVTTAIAKSTLLPLL